MTGLQRDLAVAVGILETIGDSRIAARVTRHVGGDRIVRGDRVVGRHRVVGCRDVLGRNCVVGDDGILVDDRIRADDVGADDVRAAGVEATGVSAVELAAAVVGIDRCGTVTGDARVSRQGGPDDRLVCATASASTNDSASKRLPRERRVFIESLHGSEFSRRRTTTFGRHLGRDATAADPRVAARKMAVPYAKR